MKRWLNLLGNGLSVGAIVYLAFKIKDHISELPRISLNVFSFGSIILAIAYFTFAAFLVSIAWYFLLRSGNNVISIRESFVISGKAQIAKYLPGNVFHYVSRVAQGKAREIPADSIILSSGIEILVAVGAAAIIASIGLFSGWISFGPFEHFLATPAPMYVLIVALLGVGVIVGGLWIFAPIREWAKSKRGYITSPYVGASFAIYFGVLMINGFFILLVQVGVFGISNSMSWFAYSAAFAFAWLCGFIVPGAPGGIGIRETLLVGILSKDLGEASSLALALLLRIVTTGGDLITFAIAANLSIRTDNVLQNKENT